MSRNEEALTKLTGWLKRHGSLRFEKPRTTRVERYCYKNAEVLVWGLTTVIGATGLGGLAYADNAPVGVVVLALLVGGAAGFVIGMIGGFLTDSLKGYLPYWLKTKKVRTSDEVFVVSTSQGRVLVNGEYPDDFPSLLGTIGGVDAMVAKMAEVEDAKALTTHRHDAMYEKFFAAVQEI